MKKPLLSICFSTILFYVCTQNLNEVLFSVGDESVTLSEFVNTYCKNNSLEKTSDSDLREYLNLFINFKLKVRDGFDVQIDTNTIFQRELESYRIQSAQPYLADKEVTEQLITEALERSKLMVRASHILIMCAPDALPKDTLAAYQKIHDIRKNITSGKLTFSEAATQYSEDPSARDEVGPTGKIQYGNNGDLGYFTAFDLIYSFENAAYNTPVGTVSQPIRSQFGYHIVWVQDKQPLISKINISQILLLDTAARFGRVSPNVKEKLTLIEERIQNGEDFDNLAAEYTDEPVSKANGGKIDPFPPNRRPGDFVKNCISLENEQISAPFSSVVGWHIIKLNELTKPETDDADVKHNIVSKIHRDSRSTKSVESLISKLKKEYNYSEKGKTDAINIMLKKLNTEEKMPNSSALLAISGIDKLKPIASYANNILTIQDFISFLDGFQDAALNQQAKTFLDKKFDIFINENIMKYEFNNLENKYPEYKELIKEYLHGMILFEMNNEVVWSESLKDTLGIETFYEKIKHNYLDPDGNPKTLHDIRSAVLTEFQNELENEWLNRIKERYPVWINEELFETILKNK